MGKHISQAAILQLIDFGEIHGKYNTEFERKKKSRNVTSCELGRKCESL